MEHTAMNCLGDNNYHLLQSCLLAGHAAGQNTSTWARPSPSHIHWPCRMLGKSRRLGFSGAHSPSLTAFAIARHQARAYRFILSDQAGRSSGPRIGGLRRFPLIDGMSTRSTPWRCRTSSSAGSSGMLTVISSVLGSRPSAAAAVRAAAISGTNSRDAGKKPSPSRPARRAAASEWPPIMLALRFATGTRGVAQAPASCDARLRP